MITGHRATITAMVAGVPDMVDHKGRPFEPGEISSWWRFHVIHDNGYWLLGGVIIRGKAVLAGTPRRVGASERFMSFDSDGEWRPPMEDAPEWVTEFLQFEPAATGQLTGSGQ